MVRKWSYLENTNMSLSKSVFDESLSLYHFKVFRKTTRFKKFNRGITKMVRKNYARRKHRTNWFVLSHITKAWASSYLRMRQFERFFNSITRFTFCAFSPDVSVFLLKLPEISNKSGINVASCTKSQLVRYLNQSPQARYLYNPTKYTNNATVQSMSLKNLTDSNEVYPNLTSLEGDTFFLGEQLPLTTSKSILLTPSLSFESSLYQTMILLTLFNLKR